MSNDDLAKQYALGMEYVEKNEKEKRVAELRKEEKLFMDECLRYVEYEGAEKSIAVCNENIAKAKKIIQECENDRRKAISGGKAIYDAGKQSESSWAIYGGIASGIAGGAAGVAVAADVESRNQEIRQQNKELKNASAQFSAMMWNLVVEKQRKAEEDLKSWEKKLERAKLRLVDFSDPKKLLDALKPTVNSCEISESGAVKLSIALQRPENLKIYDDVSATVDGSIQVLVKISGKVVGTAIAVLPFEGVGYNTKVNCICRSPKKRAEQYDFEVAPNKLWAVEI